MSGTPAEVDVACTERATLGEGVLWDDVGRCVLWVDIEGKTVFRLAEGEATPSSTRFDRAVTALALAVDGRVLGAIDSGFAWLDLERGTTETISTVAHAAPEMRMNDGACDPDGRFWAGSMCAPPARGKGRLYALAGDRVEQKLDGITISNGLEWSPDGLWMYFVDTPTQQLVRFSYDGREGTIDRPTVLVDMSGFDGVPDGMTVDADGHLWVAMWGGWCVRRFSPEGDPEDVLPMPAAFVTRPCFGGGDLDLLYVTTASAGVQPTDDRQPSAGFLFVARPGPRGRPPRRFVSG